MAILEVDASQQLIYVYCQILLVVTTAYAWSLPIRLYFALVRPLNWTISSPFKFYFLIILGPNGFTGTRCETQINQCASTPCLNGAQCINLVNGYICNCVTDFTGTNCQSKINNCLSMPCRNGGICTDQIGSFLCTCLTGYTGIICQSVTNYCLANNCSFGTCLNQVSSE